MSVIVIVVAILAFVGGIGVGNLLYAPKPTTSPFLVVGTNIPFPPFEDYNYSNGLYVGFDMNFSRMIAYAAHRTLVIQNFADFNVLLTTVGKNGVDMAASAITQTGPAGANRSKFMSFSNSYFLANQAVLVQTSSTLTCPSNNCTVAQLKTLIIGVQSGTTSESWADQYLIPNGTTVKTFTAVDTEIAALQAGSLGAVIIDNLPAKSLAASSGGKLKYVGIIYTGERYGFAVAKGDPEGLLPIINNVIAQSIANGTYQQMATYWGLT